MSYVDEEIKCFLCGGERMFCEFNCRNGEYTFFCNDCGYRGGLKVNGRNMEHRTKLSKVGEWDGCRVIMNPGGIVLVGSYEISPVPTVDGEVLWVGFLTVKLTEDEKKMKKYLKKDGTPYGCKGVFFAHCEDRLELQKALEVAADELKAKEEVVVNR